MAGADGRKKLKSDKDKFEEYRNEYYERCSKWVGSVDRKLEGASPYFFFLTGVNRLPHTFNENLTITFPELLDKSLGELEHSLHINYMVELPWLLAQYAINDIINPSVTILYGVDSEDLDRIPPHLNTKAIRVKSPFAFGHHHTKLSIFFYTDKSIRFAVYTANLIESDWEDRTQGVWISPKCPYLGDDVPINYGESETLFKVDILQYLKSYKLALLWNWLTRIQHSDCSAIKVCFVASVPGEHTDSYGYKKLSKLIEKYSADCNSEGCSWNLVAQCSSIGSLGESPDSWLLGEFGKSLMGNCKWSSSSSSSLSPQVSIIYPSVRNVRESIYGLAGGSCLPYSSSTHTRQLWLNHHLMQWKSEKRNRSKAVPHIKSYGKISADGKLICWFLLTSANLSKAAWGRRVKSSGLLHIMSYEAGVVFFPKNLIGKSTFTKGVQEPPGGQVIGEFPMPYDLPLSSYTNADQIFLFDKHFPR